jgi:F-type H+-transporting ATPase subunit delta
MKDRKLAGRYARALLAALPDAAARTLADEFLASLASVFESDAELRAALLDPAVSRPSKRMILRELATTHGQPERVANFLGTLVENNRVSTLSIIAEVYHELREREQGIVPAEVTTAAPLDETTRARAQTALERMTGQTVRVNYQVDPDLIGGAVTKIGSKVYDGSLKTQLALLRERMARG